MTIATHIPCELLISTWGIGVSFVTPRGHAITRLRRVSALAPDWSRHVWLGDAGASGPAVLASAGEALHAAFVTDEGTMRTTLAESGALLSDPVCVHPDARATCAVATRDGRLFVASVDPEGIVISRDTQPPTRVVSASDVAPRIAMTEGQDGVLVVYGARFGTALGVVYVRADGSEVRDVKHDLRARIESLHLVGTRRSAVVAIGLAPPADTSIVAATLGPLGAMRERPHALRASPSARYVHPCALWVDIGPAVCAIERTTRMMRIEPIAAGTCEPASWPTPIAPYAATYWEKRLTLARVALGDDEAAQLSLSRMTLSGGERLEATFAVTPRETAEIVARRRITELLEETAASLRQGGYRDASRMVDVSHADLRLDVHGPSERTIVTIAPADAAYVLTIQRSDGGRESRHTESLPTPADLLDIVYSGRAPT